MNEQIFKKRTREAALRVIRVVESLPARRTADVIGRQLLRSGTSIGANYRAACRAKSTADMVAKLGIVEEEADETLYWLELLVEAKIVPAKRLAALQSEIDEILSMVIASIKTLRARNPKSKI
jgi:four helix bundle protein